MLEQRRYVRYLFNCVTITDSGKWTNTSVTVFPSDLAPGGSDDWAYILGIKYAFTFELQDLGRYGFLLPPSRISRACNEALLAVKVIAQRVLEKTQAQTHPAHTD